MSMDAYARGRRDKEQRYPPREAEPEYLRGFSEASMGCVKCGAVPGKGDQLYEFLDALLSLWEIEPYREIIVPGEKKGQRKCFFLKRSEVERLRDLMGRDPEIPAWEDQE